MDLASRDSYVQRLASKVISQPDQARKKEQFGKISLECVDCTKSSVLQQLL